MPILIKVRIVSLKEQKISPFTGEYVRGFFLNIIRKNLPKLNLHDGKGPRPYSIKPLYPTKKKRVVNGKWVIKNGELLNFEIGILDPSIEEDILRVFITDIPERIVIENGIFEVDMLEITRFNYEELLAKDGFTFLGIEFKTPTVFSNKLDGYLFPDPVRLFGNILNIWNSFSDTLKFNKQEFLEWVDENIRVKHYKLHTREIKLKDFSITGFKGKIAFLIKPHEKYSRIVRSLIRLALISNVGKKRVFGFGVISVKDLAKNEVEDLAK